MPILAHTKHEQFAQSVAKGRNPSLRDQCDRRLHFRGDYSKSGAAAPASRLLTNANVSARIKEPKTSIAEGVMEVEIRQRSARVEVLQNNLDRMRGVIEGRALEYSGHPGRATVRKQLPIMPHNSGCLAARAGTILDRLADGG
jgi:hypothetical protein